MTASSPLVWIISDQKPGHLNQSLGLVEALKRHLPALHWRCLPVPTLRQLIPFLRQPLRSRPALIIAAGHRTHLPLLVLSKWLRVPSVVLMKPSLPTSWFDLCLIPMHDQPPPRTNILATQGPINRIQPGPKKKHTGLILIGGPSRHVNWDESGLIAQIRTITQRDPRKWTLTTSRRTPASTVQQLHTLPHIHLVSAGSTDARWLPAQLAITEQCWVTQDSLSMIYEALTAQCQVHLISVPIRRSPKLNTAIDTLIQSGMVNQDRTIELAEADRCAALIHQRFLS